MKSGLITLNAVSENDRPETSVMESINWHFDKIGTATIRKGLTLLGSALSGAILGMHYFVDTVGDPTFTQMIVANGTQVLFLVGSAWTAIRSGMTATSKARFATYLNFEFMVNGTEATAIWDGNPAGSFVTSGNAANAPIGKFIENFKSRMWIAGNSTYPDRVFFSSVPSSAITPVITWDTSPTNGQWIDISPSDGDTITALQRARDVLLVFKTNRLYRIFDIGNSDPDPYYAVGTSSQESVLETKVGTFFHHASGFYKYDIYGIVQEISRPILDIIRAIPSSAYSSIAGWVDPQGDHLCWSIGSVTYGGVTYPNMVVRYSISTQVWTHYSYPTQIVCAVRRQPLYTDGTAQYAVAGDSTGHVLLTDTGTDDFGTPIKYSLVHRWDNIDGLLSTRKNMMTGNFSHYGGAGSTVAYQMETNDPDALNDWRGEVGELGTANTGFNSMNIKARKVRFRIAGVSSGSPFRYEGYELLEVTNEFVQFPLLQ